MLNRHVTRAVVIAVAAAATITVAGAVSPASAATAHEFDYRALGTSTLANPNSHLMVKFRPTVLQTFVTFNSDGTQSVRGFLPFAPVNISYLAYGFLPTTATAVLTQVGPATGVAGQRGPDGIPLDVTARYVVSLRNVAIGGVPADVGPNCQTVYPAKITASAEPGFDLITGTLDGSYTLSRFNNCGAAQNIINDTLPGPNNTLQLRVRLIQPTT